MRPNNMPGTNGAKGAGVLELKDISKTFRTEVSADTLLNGRRGANRVCAYPVLSRYLENGRMKDMTEEHYWAMPALLQLRKETGGRAAATV